MRVVSVALALLATAACAPVPALRPVPPDGGGWRELRTDHFVLRTDLPSDRARDLLAELEAVVDGLHKGLFGEGPKELSLAVDVVAFESRRDVALFLPADVQAMVSGDAWSSRLTIVMPEFFGELQRAVVAHELTHVLIAATYARQPLWFKEGLACYAETIEKPEGTPPFSERMLSAGEVAGRALEALPHANEAVRLAPWSPSSIETLAAVAQALGRCPEALRLQRRAVENVRESDRAGQLERYLDRLASLEQSCGAGAPH